MSNKPASTASSTPAAAPSPKSKRHPFSCPDCSVPQSTEFALASHVRVMHRKDGPYPCPKCPLLLQSIVQLRSHFKVAHGGVANKNKNSQRLDKAGGKSEKADSKAPESPNKSNSNRNLKPTGSPDDGGAACDICDVRVSQSRDLAWHKKIAHDVSNGAVRPQKANAKNTTTKDRIGKINGPSRDSGKSSRAPENKKPCPLCSTYISGNNLRRHLRLVHATNADDLVKPVVTRNGAKIGVTKNLPNTPKKDIKAEAVNDDEQTLARDRRRHHAGSVRSEQNQKVVSSPEPTMRATCQVCRKEVRKSNLARHIRLCHHGIDTDSITNIVPAEKKARIENEQCDANDVGDKKEEEDPESTGSTAASSHKKDCPVCGKGLVGGARFVARHLMRVHNRRPEEFGMKRFALPPSESPVECPHCGKLCSEPRNLRKHLASAHKIVVSGVESLSNLSGTTLSKICPVCGKKMKKLHSVRRHLLVVHNRKPEEFGYTPMDLMPAKCSECGSKFSTAWSLGRHMAKAHQKKAGGQRETPEKQNEVATDNLDTADKSDKESEDKADAEAPYHENSSEVMHEATMTEVEDSADKALEEVEKDNVIMRDKGEDAVIEETAKVTSPTDDANIAVEQVDPMPESADNVETAEATMENSFPWAAKASEENESPVTSTVDNRESEEDLDACMTDQPLEESAPMSSGDSPPTDEIITPPLPDEISEDATPVVEDGKEEDDLAMASGEDELEAGPADEAEENTECKEEGTTVMENEEEELPMPMPEDFLC